MADELAWLAGRPGWTVAGGVATQDPGVGLAGPPEPRHAAREDVPAWHVAVINLAGRVRDLCHDARGGRTRGREHVRGKTRAKRRNPIIGRRPPPRLGGRG
jgi:hypothetical protein